MTGESDLDIKTLHESSGVAVAGMQYPGGFVPWGLIRKNVTNIILSTY
jgi:hypothetical protein